MSLNERFLTFRMQRFGLDDLVKVLLHRIKGFLWLQQFNRFAEEMNWE